MRISDWSSDVCSSDLADAEHHKRSLGGDAGGGRRRAGHHGVRAFRVESVAESIVTTAGKHEPDLRKIGPSTVGNIGKISAKQIISIDKRSEERRVGKECVSTCISRWSTYH